MACPTTARATLTARLSELEARAAHVRTAMQHPVSADSEEAAIDREDDDALAGEESLITRECAAISAAIHRIEAGQWGICTRCGEDIAPARLTAQPEAALCIACAGELGR